jgi:hypothetical protein
MGVRVCVCVCMCVGEWVGEWVGESVKSVGKRERKRKCVRARACVWWSHVLVYLCWRFDNIVWTHVGDICTIVCMPLVIMAGGGGNTYISLGCKYKTERRTGLIRPK